MILGPASKKKKKKKILRHTYMYIQNMCAVTFLVQSRSACTVVVLGARQQHTSSSHTVHCDLHSACNCASSSLRTSSGHGTELFYVYSMQHVFLGLFFFFFFFFSLSLFFRTPS